MTQIKLTVLKNPNNENKKSIWKLIGIKYMLSQGRLHAPLPKMIPINALDAKNRQTQFVEAMQVFHMIQVQDTLETHMSIHVHTWHG